MASRAETAVNEAVRALVERNYDLALRVKADDSLIDQLEIEIDNLASSYWPKLRWQYLRFVMVAMKIHRISSG